MNKLHDAGLFIFRVTIGAFMMFSHGLGKLKTLFSGEEIQFTNFLGLGATISLGLCVLAEFLAAFFIIIGLFTRLSSLTLIINMFVAGFIVHAQDPFGRKEMALMYLVCFILLLLTGPGRYSLQNLFMKKIKTGNRLLKFILG